MQTTFPATSPFKLDEFKHPPAHYRGVPFWAWNGKLDRDELLRQVAVFKQMGMGGFHIHARTGLQTPYLSDEFMALVSACVEEAEKEGLYVWLYDEDRYPSGYGGGLVTQEVALRAKYLLWTRDPEPHRQSDNAVLLGRYRVLLEDGYLAYYERLENTDVRDVGVWTALLLTQPPSPWFNHQAYVDTLNPQAVKRFIEVTHERYNERIGKYFGTVVPGIFTDEPEVIHKQYFLQPEDENSLVLPWTGDFPKTYQEAYNDDLLSRLPELFWELPNGSVSQARYHYHDHLCERFTSAFMDQIGSWCAAHQLTFTGHLMEEQTLHSQTAVTGEIMRQYRSMALPGIDMLCEFHQYNTAKQAQSVAHQLGRSGVMCELYGVTNWDFDFAGYKTQGDWLAALGVTMRVHHHAWYTMAGEAKRDYPPSIFYQSPWWQAYPVIEDHFARLNVALMKGKRCVRIGVIHPIESFWLAYGPYSQAGSEREQREGEFETLTEWLLFNQLDFDFIAESLLADLPSQPGVGQLSVGEGAYDIVIVPNLKTIRASTLDRLERFRAHGGTILFLGGVPVLEDAQPSSRAATLANLSVQLPFEKAALLLALEPFRDLRVRFSQEGSSLIYQLRQYEAGRRFLFFANVEKAHAALETYIHITGIWQVLQLDTSTGAVNVLPADYVDDTTVVRWDFEAHGSLLLQLEHATSESIVKVAPLIHRSSWREVARLTPYAITRCEPNAFLLNRAQWQVNSEGWQMEDEVLRIDRRLRDQMGLPVRSVDMPQPWSVAGNETILAELRLRFAFQTDVDLANVQLALEDVEHTQLLLDDEPIAIEIGGWFVDKAIQVVPLPPMRAGRHTITLIIPFTQQTNMEWCYLLGDFGVEIRGREALIVASTNVLQFGDWTAQGLPFYTGNITYHCRMTTPTAELLLYAPSFKAPLLGVTLDEQPMGTIAFAPYRLPLGLVKAGEHHLSMMAYGNRANTFGALHNANPDERWFGPSAWRTEGSQWSDDYRLKPMGILESPVLLARVQDEDTLEAYLPEGGLNG